MRFAVALMLLPVLPFVPIAAPAFAQAAPDAGAQDEALLQFLDGAFDERLALSPESKTRLGLKTDYNKLDDYTEADVTPWFPPAGIRAQRLCCA